MDVKRYCTPSDLNWGALPEIVQRLGRLGLEVTSSSIELERGAEQVTYKDLEGARRDVARHGTPEEFSITLHGNRADAENPELPSPSELFYLYVSRSHNAMRVSMSGIDDKAPLDDVMDFLGLEPEEPKELLPEPVWTAFIAHKFDPNGISAVDRLSRFLELLGFAVVSGRSYSTQSISAKVLSRIEAQETLFVVLTPGEDETWLIQESVIGQVKGKPLFILKEQQAEFKPGMLADHEFIPFTLPHIETAFIAVLEGLRELGYLER